MYWLIKSEPSAFSIDALMDSPKQTTGWDGVRNYQARNMMRDQMQIGDLAFFYHSNCDEPGIVGIVKVVKAAYPDDTALDPKDHHYDPRATKENPIWCRVDVQFVKKFKTPISLRRLREITELENMLILRKGNRLSITPVTEKEWHIISLLGAA